MHGFTSYDVSEIKKKRLCIEINVGQYNNTNSSPCDTTDSLVNLRLMMVVVLVSCAGFHGSPLFKKQDHLNV